MLRNVFTKTLWDARRALLAWALGMAGVSAMYAAFYPSVSESGAELLETYPDALREAFNLQDFSAAGYLGSSVFGLLGPLLIIVFAVATGTRAIATDEENGTLELLLAHPVDRTRLVLQRFAALVAATVGLGAAVLVVLLAIRGPARLDVPAGNMAAMVGHLVLLGLCFGTLAIAVGAATGRRSVVLAVTAVPAVVGYVANAFLPQVDGLEWARNVSPFHYYQGGEPLRHGLQVADVGVLVGIVAVLLGVAVMAFNRRDVAV